MGMDRDAVWTSLGATVFRVGLDGELDFADGAIPLAVRAALPSLADLVPTNGTTELVVERWRVTARRDGDAIVGLVLPVADAPRPSFASLYAAAPMAMQRIDREGRLLDVNRAWSLLTGYASAEAVGRPLDFLMSEQTAARAAEELLPQLWRDGRLAGAECEFVRADGSTFEVELDCTVITSEGEPVCVSMVRDVTVRRRAQRALEASEAQLRRVLERSPDGILLHREGRIVFANIPAATFLGHEELVGEPLPREVARVEGRGEVRLATADARERALEILSLDLESETADAGLVIVRDLTERRLLQAKLTQADRLATVGMLAASVAHEINNPLTYVMHYIERLERDLGSMQGSLGDPAALSSRLNKLAEGARTAGEGCARVRDIVRDLKTFGKVEGGQDVPIDVNRALRSAIQMASRQVRSRARLRVGLGALPAVRAHDGRLCQVFLNLLLNAAQAIDASRARSEESVEVRSWTEDAHVHVAVRDSGCGIEPSARQRLFEPFFSTKEEGVGTGLGLWICQEIVQELGGEIRVESEPGEGSTFTVVLPHAGTAATPFSSLPPPPASTLEPIAVRRVLVVDDEPALRELLAVSLGEHADVVTASGGSEARELLQHDPDFDAILCDLMMPNGDGAELYAWVRTMFPALSQRMIFMTGASHSKGARQFLESVGNERLDKPFRVRDVERILDRVIDASIRVHA